jgi:hypothetical protein
MFVWSGSPGIVQPVPADNYRRLPLFGVLRVDDSWDSAIGAANDDPCWLDGTIPLTDPAKREAF